MPPETVVWTILSKAVEQAPVIAVLVAVLMMLAKGMLVPRPTIDRMWVLQDQRNTELVEMVKTPIAQLVVLMDKLSEQTATRTQEATKEHMGIMNAQAGLMNALNMTQRSMDDLNRRINGKG